MATYKAIANGNADTLGIWETWNGAAWVAAGSLPTTTDDVYTNNFIVTITTSQSYLSWNRSSVAAPLSITQGGQFQIDGGNAITTQGNIVGANVSQTSNNPLSACVNRLVTHIAKWTHIGNISAQTAVGYISHAYGAFNASTSDIDLFGNQSGGFGDYAFGFYNNAAATFNIVGNQSGGIGTASYGFLNNATSTFTSIVGNQTSSTGTFSNGFQNSAASIFSSIIGNQSGSLCTQGYGFSNNATSTFTSIVGNQIGGSSVSSYGFGNGAVSTFTSIVGNQIGNAGYGFYNSVNNIVTFNGNAIALGVAAIYNGNSSATIIYTGNVYNNLSVMAIFSQKLFLNVTPTTVWEFSDFDGDTQYLYGAGVNTGHPTEANVRKDTVYGPNDEFEGTLAVPPPETVNVGVPVDNTVGTYSISPALAARLGAVATIDELAALLESFSG